MTPLREAAAASADRAVETYYRKLDTPTVIAILEAGRKAAATAPGNIVFDALNGTIERELERRQGGRFDA